MFLLFLKGFFLSCLVEEINFKLDNNNNEEVNSMYERHGPCRAAWQNGQQEEQSPQES